MAKILIVDDEPGIRSFLKEAAELFGHQAQTAEDGAAAWTRLQHDVFDVLLTDLTMPVVDGMELLRSLQRLPDPPVALVLTAHGSIETAVEAMKLGALDYLQKPLGELSELRALLDRAARARTMAFSRAPAPESAGERPFPLGFGDSRMAQVERMLLRVARTPANALLLGESGVGKEKAARFLHLASPRAGKPFVAINCASLSETLFESELFGHQRGAFTGANESRAGRLEAASGGTVFLDEIGELRPDLQARLLRVLETRAFERVGSNQTQQVDVRWIAATNRDLRAMVESGLFRADLYHRLATFPVLIPPLRERRDDIVPLATVLMEEVTQQFAMESRQLDESARLWLRQQSWRGNVRDLKNSLERAVVLLDQRVLTGAALQSLEMAGVDATGGPGSTEVTLGGLERDAIVAALAQHRGNRRLAAEQLGIGLRTLYYKLRKYSLEDSP